MKNIRLENPDLRLRNGPLSKVLAKQDGGLTLIQRTHISLVLICDPRAREVKIVGYLGLHGQAA